MAEVLAWVLLGKGGNGVGIWGYGEGDTGGGALMILLLSIFLLMSFPFYCPHFVRRFFFFGLNIRHREGLTVFCEIGCWIY